MFFARIYATVNGFTDWICYEKGNTEQEARSQALQHCSAIFDMVEEETRSGKNKLIDLAAMADENLNINLGVISLNPFTTPYVLTVKIIEIYE